MNPSPHPRPGVELGLLLPTSEPTVFDDADPLGRLVDLARRAEGLGYDSLWAGESLQWLPYSTDPASYAAGLAAVTHAGLATGRPPTDVTPALFVTTIVTDDHTDGEAQLDAYCHATYALPASAVRGIQLIVVGPAAHVADSLSPYVDAGARHLVVRIGTLHTGDQPERIADALGPLRARTAPEEATAHR